MKNLRLLGVWLFAVTLLSGCATPVDSSYEYLLMDNSNAQIETEATKRISVQLMPIVVANYLAGNEIVLVTSRGEVHRSQLNLWAEPLSPQLTRLTQQRLEKSLPNLTWFVRQRLPSYSIAQLDIEVDSFFADLNGVVHISGRWQLISSEGELILSKAFAVEDTLKKDGYGAMSETLAKNWFEKVVMPMSHDIARMFNE
ncbi:ABC-type transport auxiliary lipoprotein family protein [Marinomonas sp. 15G1-11]|uniref:ABC-type transport auxiliary lipoprotein family protein n=1 Tax=Marinomonas phaeophyticola TaxID=3004091 RepID=A0ABT4JYV2_9GAMM|nr:ABC-type transport auxiliary lipoprotein family protein [Marinomonas sp. 15G1-11]MCZ2723448.1 ABC-type transport auxiliary lipoprotein family protein [Marinomonas sp. 15G1-11]